MSRSPRVPTLVLAAVALAFAAAPAAADAAATTPPPGVKDYVLNDMDRSADPCSDFWRYACGGWLDRTEIPSDESSWGRGFSEIEERNRDAIRSILEASAKNPGPDPEMAKPGIYFGTCLDEAAIEKAGLAPLAPMLDEIARVRDAATMMAVAGRLARNGIPALLNMEVDADFKDPSKNIAHLFQGGMGLPERDYYFKEDEEGKALLVEYEAHIARQLALLGEPKEAAARHAKAVLAFETELARSAMKRAEMRDPEKIYHKVDLAGLKKLSGALDWDGYLKALGHPSISEINVATPGFFEGMAGLVPKTDAETLQAYLRWGLARSASPHMIKAMVDENFSFYGKRLFGQEEIQPRWKRCVDGTDAALGEIVGRLYVEKHFAGDSKKIALDMVRRIEAAFEANLPELGWMDDATRARAVEKMKAIRNKIGYPDTWRDYSKLKLRKGDHFGNVLAARGFEIDRNLAKVGKPVDKDEWGMTPPTVNAYYNPLNNEMVFPAGILQPPYFDKDYPMGMNFGGIGMIVGHELTHGFDDSGRKFDPQGRMVEWWDPSVSARFEKAAACVEAQYGGWEIQPGLKLNGQLTLGENIADLGGIKQAFRAYKAWLKEKGNPPSPIPGLTNDQIFFVGFAQGWCTENKPEMEKVMVATDPHAPPIFRVRGPLVNLPEFSETFQCKAGTPMNPPDRCQVW